MSEGSAARASVYSIRDVNFVLRFARIRVAPPPPFPFFDFAYILGSFANNVSGTVDRARCLFLRHFCLHKKVVDLQTGW